MSIHVKISNKGFKEIDNPNKLSNAGYLLNGWKIH
jgi:hypothetical protein